ncbi:MBL fold metallo-hydrolase [Pseudalkalibacillus berkeleyi]|uniref:MBL fold metallo-hydrolase n=1 Tax=Pseudalkalibacillus berkeleyi TaxID=1069813 RepID=A0ABS9GVF6_9BACL|nr:MBL fold metallo-hydrolase [Pseudalkalibacillus berkeleyi]MCF6136674.1 MBL fold metallo-hydrolase [Pseudalkalibacillus berkeleyi]
MDITKFGDVESLHVKCSAGHMYLHYYLYFVDGMLVDAGPKSCEESIIPYFKTKKINTVALTHFHEDHTGNVRWLQDHMHPEIYIHPMSLDICARDGQYPDYRHEFWGSRDGFHAKPIRTSVQSDNFSWEAIHTPGHSRDHLVFYNKETGRLFSGDLFVTPKPKISMWQESIPTVMDSIRTVLTYDFDEMFCAHAGYVPNGRVMLEKKLDYLISTHEQINSLYQQGLTLEEIDAKMYAQESPLKHISKKEWDSLHFVRSMIKDEPSLR